MLNGSSINSHPINGSPSVSVIINESILEDLNLNDSTGALVPGESLLNNLSLDDIVVDSLSTLFNESLLEDLSVDDILGVLAAIANILEDLNINDVLIEQRLLVFFETITLNDTVIIDIVEGIIETISLQSTANSAGLFDNFQTDDLSLDDVIKLIFTGNILDVFTLDDTVDVTVSLLSSISNIINTSDTISSAITAISNLAETIVIADTLLHGFRQEITEDLQITSSTLELLTLLSQLVDSLEISLTSTDTLLFISSISDEVTLDDSLLSNQEVLSTILENLEMVVVNEADDIFSGWVLNPETFAIWNYDNYNFNSMATLGQRTFLANFSGLFTMEGSLDDTSFIQSRLKTRSYDFGTTNLKQVPDMYVGLSLDGKMVISVQTDERLEVKYKLVLPTDVSELQTIKLGKGLRGSSWQFELVDEDATEFNLSSIEWIPVVFGRKRR